MANARRRENFAWIKLDNAATIYPPSRTRGWAAMFRLSVTLNEEIDRNTLAAAQTRTLKRLPSFACRLRKGLFWYYFEHIRGTPEIQEDVGNPLVRMNFKENDRFMFRVRYYNNRIAVEFFHALTDGTGGMCFLLTLTAEYLRLRHGAKIASEGLVLDCADAPRAEESEDAFMRFARKVGGSRLEQPAYRISGAEEHSRFLNITSGILSVQAVRAKAGEYGASVTAFLAAVLIDCFQEKQFTEKRNHRRKLPVKVQIPINLRNFYPTTTVRNFASYVNIGVNSNFGRYDFAEIINVVKHTMGLEISEKNQNSRIAANVRSERNPFVRALPLALKAPLMKALFFMQGDRYNSTILSNLGNINLPEAMRPYVQRVDFVLGGMAQNPVACACAGLGDCLVINFSRKIRDPQIERMFFTKLVKMGLHVCVESNRR